MAVADRRQDRRRRRGSRDAHCKSGKFDYDAPIPGLEVVDRYTLRIRLRKPDLRFLYAFAIPNTAAVAREVVEAYGADFGAHPVGTGPYMLGEYQRSARIVLEANPGFRETTYVPAGPVPPESRAIAAALKGRKLPLVGRIRITVIEEGQALWLAFANRELDLLERVPADFVSQALVDGKLNPDLAARGIRHETLLRPNTRWMYFNMEDPVVGGYTPEKIALRRAISMGYDVGEFIRVILKGPRGPGDESDSARCRRLRSGAKDRGAALRSGRRARAAGPLRVPGSRRRRLSRDARTASRSCSSAGRRRRRSRARRTSN